MNDRSRPMDKTKKGVVVELLSNFFENMQKLASPLGQVHRSFAP